MLTVHLKPIFWFFGRNFPLENWKKGALSVVMTVLKLLILIETIALFWFFTCTAACYSPLLCLGGGENGNSQCCHRCCARWDLQTWTYSILLILPKPFEIWWFPWQLHKRKHQVNNLQTFFLLIKSTFSTSSCCCPLISSEYKGYTGDNTPYNKAKQFFLR